MFLNVLGVGVGKLCCLANNLKVSTVYVINEFIPFLFCFLIFRIRCDCEEKDVHTSVNYLSKNQNNHCYRQEQKNSARILSQESDTNHRSSNQSLCSSSLGNDAFGNDYVTIAKSQKSPDSTASPSNSSKETNHKKSKKKLHEDGELPLKSNEGSSSSGTVLFEDSLDCGVTLSHLKNDCSSDQRDRSGPR